MKTTTNLRKNMSPEISVGNLTGNCDSKFDTKNPINAIWLGGNSPKRIQSLAEQLRNKTESQLIETIYDLNGVGTTMTPNACLLVAVSAWTLCLYTNTYVFRSAQFWFCFIVWINLNEKWAIKDNIIAKVKIIGQNVT